MALINCPECSTEVSERAPKCIKCGYPIATKLTTSLQTEPVTPSIVTPVEYIVRVQDSPPPPPPPPYYMPYPQQEPPNITIKQTNQGCLGGCGNAIAAIVGAIVFIIVMIGLCTSSESGELDSKQRSETISENPRSPKEIADEILTIEKQ